MGNGDLFVVRVISCHLSGESLLLMNYLFQWGVKATKSASCASCSHFLQNFDVVDSKWMSFISFSLNFINKTFLE